MEYRIIEVNIELDDNVNINVFYPQLKISETKTITTGKFWWKKTEKIETLTWKYFIRNEKGGFYYFVDDKGVRDKSNGQPVYGRTKEEAEDIIKQREKERKEYVKAYYEKNAFLANEKENFKIHEYNNENNIS